MKLIAVTDDRQSVNDLASIIIGIKDNIDFVHIRERSKKASELVQLLQLLDEGNVSKEKIVINDRFDLALLYGIPNVHLPGHGLPVQEVKNHSPHLNVGCSVHSLEEAKQAERDGADYILYGHCFETNSKQGLAPNGIRLLSEIVQALHIPVYAIGGITQERISLIHSVSADGIAIMSGIFSARDPMDRTQGFYDQCKGEQG